MSTDRSDDQHTRGDAREAPADDPAQDLTAARGRLAFALDYPDLESARAGAARVAREVGVFKVGLELFTSAGPSAVELARSFGRDVFLDLKLHDIPETVARAALAAAQLGVKLVTVHASGGTAMIQRAVDSVRGAAERGAPPGAAPTEILAVTVLTSLSEADLGAIGVDARTGDHAERLARLAIDAGASGFVCSAGEVARLRAAFPSARIVVPGIRPGGRSSRGGDDQARIGSPARAIRSGADLLVVGRPIRDSADPARAAREVVLAIASALPSSV